MRNKDTNKDEFENEMLIKYQESELVLISKAKTPILLQGMFLQVWKYRWASFYVVF